MGVTWSAQAVLPFGVAPEQARRAVQARLDRLIAEVSHWEPDSALSRFNRAAAGEWVNLPDDLWTVLDAGLALAARTDGAFDPTLGRLVDLWGFGPEGSRLGTPTDQAIDALRADAGWLRLELSPDDRAARQPGGLSLDLSGIAKGYGVDLVVQTLAELGVGACLIEIGGELRGAGVQPDGQPWWVEIETPPDLASAPSPIRLALHGLAVATSGDYRIARSVDGRRLAHTLDPRTGAPLADAAASVSVIHETCMQADALSTVLTVFGPEVGLAFAETKGVAARILTRNGEEHLSSAFRAMLD